jgi:hypothetical protein
MIDCIEMAGQAALLGGLILAPGLTTFGTGNSASIFPEDQGSMIQSDLERALAMQQAAQYEDTGVSDQNASGSDQSILLLGSMVSGVSLCLVVFMMMMVMI